MKFGKAGFISNVMQIYLFSVMNVYEQFRLYYTTIQIDFWIFLMNAQWIDDSFQYPFIKYMYKPIGRFIFEEALVKIEVSFPVFEVSNFS